MTYPTPPKEGKQFSDESKQAMEAEAMRILAEISAAKSEKARVVEGEKAQESGVLDKVSIAAELTQNAAETGESLSELLASASAGTTSGIVETVVSALIFVLLPLEYLMSAVRGTKPPPFTPTTAAKWASAGVLLGLGIAILLVPGAWPALATVGAVLTGIRAVRNLVELIRGRRELNKLKEEFSELEQKIAQKDAILSEVIELEKKIADNPTMSKRDLEVCLYRSLELKELWKCSKLADIEEKQFITTQRIAELEKTGTKSYAHLDRNVGVFLACLGLAGAVTLFFFPPVGLAILTAASALAGTYTLFRLGQTYLPRVSNWFKEKLFSPQDKDNAPKETIVQNSPTVTEASTQGRQNKGAWGTEASVNLGTGIQETQNPSVTKGALDQELVLDKGLESQAAAFTQNVEQDSLPSADLGALHSTTRTGPVRAVTPSGLEVVSSSSETQESEASSNISNTKQIKAALKEVKTACTEESLSHKPEVVAPKR